jgi:hypothetical protein
MNAFFKFTVLVLAVSATLSSHATTLPFVDGTYIAGSLDVIAAPFGGTLVDSMISSAPMAANGADPSSTNPTTTIGTLISSVYDTGAGLDFYYQITNDKLSTGNLTNLLGWFKPLERAPVQMFQTSVAIGSFKTGTVPIDTVGREGLNDLWDTPKVATNLLWVNFSSGSAVTPDSASYIEIIRTTGISRSSVADFSLFFGGGQGGGTVTGFIPWSEPIVPVVTPVPEPETYALMLAGLGLIGAVVRRRKEAQA